MSLIALDFIDNPPASTTRQMKRQTVGGAKTVGFLLPFDVEIVALVLQSDAAVAAGQATCQARAAGVGLSQYPVLTWAAGTTASKSYPSKERTRIAAGNSLDIEVTTNGTYAPGTQELICTAILRVLP